MPRCIDCAHCIPVEVPDGRGPNDYSYATEYQCNQNPQYSPVTGAALQLPDCEDERKDYGNCGPNGSLWQPKSKVTGFWAWLFGPRVPKNPPVQET